MSLYNIGDVVKVKVKFPAGTNTYTKGNIGIISEIYKSADDEYEYTVHTSDSDFVYIADELERAGVEDVRNELKRLLIKFCR